MKDRNLAWYIGLVTILSIILSEALPKINDYLHPEKEEKKEVEPKK